MGNETQKYYQGMYNMEYLKREKAEKERDHLKKQNMTLLLVISVMALWLIAVIWIG